MSAVFTFNHTVNASPCSACWKRSGRCARPAWPTRRSCAIEVDPKQKLWRLHVSATEIAAEDGALVQARLVAGLPEVERVVLLPCRCGARRRGRRALRR